jgi:hypothetical protein
MDVQLGYSKGMAQDISPVKRDKDSYFEALNIRIATADGSSTGSITNDLGNTLLFKVPTLGAAANITNITVGGVLLIVVAGTGTPIACPALLTGETTADALYRALLANATINNWLNTTHKIYIKNNRTSLKIVIYDWHIGSYIVASPPMVSTVIWTGNETPMIVNYTQMRDSLILFTTNSNGTSSQIWKLDYNFSSSSIVDLVAGSYLDPQKHLVYADLFPMQFDSRGVEIMTKYTNPTFGKVYWSDGTTALRHLNILDPDSLGTELSMTQLLPNVALDSPIFVSLSEGGYLKSGMIQYAYQLYNFGSAETLMSPSTPLIHLTLNNIANTDTSTYKGDSIEVITNKTATIQINNIDLSFDFIKVWSIHYSAIGIPIITLIREDAVTSSTYLCIDAGNTSLDTLTQTEFASVGGVVLIPKCLTTKDNYLIAANIDEEVFDVDEVLGTYWDARAYRWNVAGSEFKCDATVYTDATTIGEETNCATLESEYTAGYKYNKITHKLGGSGTNISYSFNVGTIGISDSTAETNQVGKLALDWSTWISSDYSDITDYFDYSSPYNHGYLAGYAVGEVYRFGIEFYNSGSRRSFVKWIGDIRIPTFYELTLDGDTAALADINGDGTVVSSNIGISFSVNNIPNNYRYRIVRVQREQADKRVVTMAALRRVSYNGGGSLITEAYFSEGWDVTDHTLDYTLPMGSFSPIASNDLFVAVTPQICFPDLYSSIESLTGLRQEVIGYLKWTGTQSKLLHDFDFGSPDIGTSYINYGITKYTETVNINITADSGGTPYLVDDSILLGTEWATQYGLSGTSIIYRNSTYPLDHYWNDEGEDKNYAIRAGRGIYYRLNTTFDNLTIGSAEYIPVVLFTRDVDSSRYGGSTFSSRSVNTYIPCSIVTSSNSCVIYGGDTYSVMFDYQSSTAYTNVAAGVYYCASTAQIPLQTPINTSLRQDTCFTRSTIANERWKLQHTSASGISIFNNPPSGEDVGDYPATYTNLYLINPVYTMENTLVRGFPKPLHYSSNNMVDYRIISSQPSIANESVDSWTKFYANDFIDLDSQYGAINKIVVNNNILVALQDNAFSAIAFKDRQLLQDNLQGQLVLGTGSILSYVRYISTKTGTKSKWSVVDLDNNMLWFDTMNRKIMRYSGEGLEVLSDNKNMTSFFKAKYPLVKDDDFLTGVHAVVNKKDNRIYFTFSANLSALPDSMTYSLYDNLGTTISYNLMSGTFESLHTFAPKMYMETELGLVSTYSNTQGWIHGSSTYCNYFGTQYGFNITHLMGSTTKASWTNIEFNSEHVGSEVKPDSIIFTNSYGTATLTDDTKIIRRFRTYRVALPRQEIVTYQRFVDYWLKVKLIYDSTPTVVRLDDITLKYLIPII